MAEDDFKIEKVEAPRSFSAFLGMLEDGTLNDELSKELRDLNAEMNNHALNYGSKAKGKVTLNIEFVLEKGVFQIQSKYKVDKPKAPRLMSIAWSTPGNNFTPHNPKQGDMFKDVNNKKIRNV